MKKHHIIEDTIQILESIVERANIIQHDRDRELCLDIDLMLEDLRLLYRNYEALKKHCEAGHAHEPTVDKSEDATQAEDQPIPSFFEEEELDEEGEAVADSSPEGQPAGTSARQLAASPGQSEKNNPGDAKGSNGKTVIDLFSQHQTRSIGDQFGQDDNSLHQRISGQKEDKSIGARLQQHPINSIKDAIGLNEKFLFINELFEGDIQVYNEAIAKLNNMGSMKEAFDYLNELTAVHHWDAKRSAETIEKLAGFVQRRYLDR